MHYRLRLLGADLPGLADLRQRRMNLVDQRRQRVGRHRAARAVGADDLRHEIKHGRR